MRKLLLKTSFIPVICAMLLPACGASAVSSNSASSNDISSSSDSSAPAHEHTFSDAWLNDNEYHWHPATCEHKEEVSNKETHSFVKGETIPATTEAQGYTLYTCSVCGFSKSDDFVDKIDPYKNRIKNKEFKVINLSYERQNANDPRFYEDAKPLSTYLKPDTYKLYYLDKINDVYYLPLSTYADLFKGDFQDGVVNTFTQEGDVSTWTSKLNDSTYTLSIDKNNQTLSVKGSLEEFFKKVPNGRNGLFDQASFAVTYAKGHEEKVKTFSFKDYGFDIFEADGKTCFPLGLIACETSKYIERKFFTISYDGYLLEYADGEQYNGFTYLNDKNEEVKFTDLMTESYKKLYGEKDEGDAVEIKAPKALTEFNKKIIYYLFNNYYGLASVRQISSMSNYFENLEVSSKYFTDSNGVNRGSAYAFALQGLNDLHTSYGYSPYTGESANDSAINTQSFYKDRTNLNTILGGMREREIEKYNKEKSTDLVSTNVRYSNDGKYAYFSFDGFSTYTYYEEGNIPENELLSDSFHLFVKNLNEIKAKGTVKRVFIDDSLNGGGYVAIMGKLLALMSKDNKYTMYLREQSDDSIQQLSVRVDSNKDGVYDEKDCFGNDFKFYIITSGYSFSCGNAFPFYADKTGLAKIIGTQSGGGECCVSNYTLPTGQSITYSSTLHIGIYDAEKDTFAGDEEGAFPYIPASKTVNIYDIESLASFVTMRDPF